MPEDPANPHFKELEILTDTYKHHFDLLMKGYLLYLLIIFGVAGLTIGKGLGADVETFMFSIISLISLLMALACGHCCRVVSQLKTAISQVRERLGMGGPVPVFAGPIVVIGLLGALAFGVGAVLIATGVVPLPGTA